MSQKKIPTIILFYFYVPIFFFCIITSETLYKFYIFIQLITGNGNNTQIQSDNQHQSRPLSQSEMEVIENRMQQRSDRLNEKCTEFGLDSHGKSSCGLHI